MSEDRNAAQSRAERAGLATGAALVEMVHLMYQKNTAANFWRGLMAVLDAHATDSRLACGWRPIRGGWRPGCDGTPCVRPVPAGAKPMRFCPWCGAAITWEVAQ